jgi:hypothetical protein
MRGEGVLDADKSLRNIRILIGYFFLGKQVDMTLPSLHEFLDSGLK